MGTWTPGPGPTTGPDVFEGDDSNEIALGGDGNDVLNGGGGNDALDGELGDDELYGGDGDDTLSWTSGNDVLSGGGGNDLIVLHGIDPFVLDIQGGDGEDILRVIDGRRLAGSTMSGVETVVVVDRQLGSLIADASFYAGISTLLAWGSIGLTSPGTLDLSGVSIPDAFTFDGVDYTAELQVFGAEGGNNVLTMPGASVAHTRLHGAELNDTLTGGGGNDDLLGWAGDDILNGGDGDDELDAGAGNDVVNGGAGDDVITRRFGGNTGSLVADGGDGFDRLLLRGGSIDGSSQLSNIEVVVVEDFFNPTTITPTALSSLPAIWSTGRLILAGPGTVDLTNVSLPNMFEGINNQLTIDGSSGDDTIIVPADAEIWLGLHGKDGNDTLWGGNDGDLLTGGAGNDALFGQGGADTIQWDAGSDQIDGGAGNDTVFLLGLGSASGVLTLNGGDGADTLVAQDVVFLDGSTISGFETLFFIRGNQPSQGLIVYAPGVLPNAGTYGAFNTWLAPNTAGVTDLSNVSMPETFMQGGVTYANAFTFQGSAGNDTLLFPALAGARLFAFGNAGNDDISGGEKADELHGGADSDTLAGRVGDDQLSGDAGNDVLNGGDGDDLINGGSGGDVMEGGAGDDSYFVDNGGDVVTDSSLVSEDIVFASVNWMLGANIEHVTLTGSNNLNALGNNLGNIITGNDANNVLDGAGGADTLIGGFGNDYYIYDGADTISEGSEFGGVDVVQSAVTVSLTGMGYVENVLLTGAANINATGNFQFNKLWGNSGVNTLNGGAGDDVLDGKAGADTMIGGTGNDYFYVDNASDVVTELVGEGTDTLQANVSYTLSANVENMVLGTTANINATGNALNNRINGNTGSNTINGGVGADAMIGGFGNDSYVVDNAGDTISEGSASGGIDLVSSSVSYTLIGTGYVENLTLTGSAGISGAGNFMNNTITGNTGANLLSGGAGNDTLSGGNGNDTLNGGAGMDTLTGGANNDTFVFADALGTSNVDTITDFSVPNDTVHLSTGVFTGIAAGALAAGAFHMGAAAADADDRIVYNSATGALYYDADGNGAGAAVQFATLGVGLALTNADFFGITP